jgi:Tfp pilus assembly protein PilN
MDPLETGKLLILLAGLAGLYLKLHQALRAISGKGESREISNNPLKVQEEARAATVHDLQRMEKRISHIENEMRGMKQDSLKAREKIHDEISDLRDRIDDKLEAQADIIRDQANTLRAIERSLGRLESH